VSPARTVRGRLADSAYLLDRALKTPGCCEDFARAALDTLRIALRPSYSGLALRLGSRSFHCGDSVLTRDIEALVDVLARAPRHAFDPTRSIRRDEAPGLGIAGLELAMTTSAFDLVFPIADGETLLGLIALGPRTDRRPWSVDEVEFCDRVGSRLALTAAREKLTAEVASLRANAVGSERLASVGRMAAGLAHEIRNPLVSIRTFTQLLPERHADEEFRSSFLDLTRAEIDRISTLVGEILSFARSAAAGEIDDADATTDVAACVERTCMLLRSHARSAGVSLDFEVDEIAERALIDEDRLRQVIINLVVNGIQACDGRGGVRVDAVSVPSGAIVVEVSDDGPGMSPEVASRIFEPFFTTRSEGTGLGLAMVKTLLDQAGATIDVFTAPAGGSTFRIALPTPTLLASRTRATEPVHLEGSVLDAAEPARLEEALLEESVA
jgi:signal transduction histidine kinase